MDLETKTDKELDQWIVNYERKPGATALPFYRELLEERARRAQAKQRLTLSARWSIFGKRQSSRSARATANWPRLAALSGRKRGGR